MGRVDGTVLLVGSVPLNSVREVFETCAGQVGKFVSCLPDGEVGDRKLWSFTVAMDAYDGNPALEAHKAEVYEPGVKEADQGDRDDRLWSYRIRDRAAPLSFDALRYAQVAAESYAIFTDLRSQGVIAPAVRFQVSLPTTAAATMPFFREADDLPVARTAYQDAIRVQIAQMLELIPADDLVIQWDIATEIRDLLAGEGALFPWTPLVPIETKWRRHLDDLQTLTQAVPSQALLGFHFCFGTYGGWPHSTAADASVCVRYANEAVARADRAVDYVHIPVMPDADAGWFAPLQDLRLKGTRVFLGVVLDDGLQGFRHRVRMARAHVPEFGVASYCGWGREDPAHVPKLLADLRASADDLLRGGAAA